MAKIKIDWRKLSDPELSEALANVAVECLGKGINPLAVYEAARRMEVNEQTKADLMEMVGHLEYNIHKSIDDLVGRPFWLRWLDTFKHLMRNNK